MTPSSAPTCIIPIEDSNHLLADPTALRLRFQEQGYLYLKALLPRHKVQVVQDQIFSVCRDKGWFAANSRSVADESPCILPTVEGENEFFRVYDDVQRLEAFHCLAHQPEILDVMRILLDASAFPHPLSICRLMFPDNTETTTPPHQDYPNNQGTTELYACWIPLSDCPLKLGGLAFMPGSHKHGLLPLEFSLGAGNRQATLPEALREKPWVAGDYEQGDVLIFHSLMLHRSLDNLSDRMRLSVDYRYQSAYEPLTEECLHPHFKRLSWDDIYQDWHSKDLQYYWKKLPLTFVPWTTQYHDLPEEHLNEAIKLARAYQKRRKAKAQGPVSLL
ncbi:phytanoyl-CoA dioxygenase family protein [Pseudomonas sp. WS 5013]|uniref:phytanoyl-CoA dioxygenase family protein n=1 Tax=Pseudomonas sp. WS 5013 TaxID=2717475 RepID=UPI0014743ABC|nr:phytanoyl-CoA dioxygenase family protein [Pseudomonas sp. WS 5013]NMY42785.1 phytanoyl-CoA dioxygenase family protein [Pseudomonas sp. WS 5013]